MQQAVSRTMTYLHEAALLGLLLLGYRTGTFSCWKRRRHLPTVLLLMISASAGRADCCWRWLMSSMKDTPTSSTLHGGALHLPCSPDAACAPPDPPGNWHWSSLMLVSVGQL